MSSATLPQFLQTLTSFGWSWSLQRNPDQKACQFRAWKHIGRGVVEIDTVMRFDAASAREIAVAIGSTEPGTARALWELPIYEVRR